MDSSLFGDQRIHLGAYEATLLADAYFCRGAELFLQKSQGFLVREAPRNAPGALPYTNSLLHIQRCYRQVARLAEHRHFLCFRGGGISLRDKTFQGKQIGLQVAEATDCGAIDYCNFIRDIYLPDTRNRNLPRPYYGYFWNTKFELNENRLATIPRADFLFRMPDKYPSLEKYF